MKRLFLAAALAALMLVPATSASAALTGEYAKFSTCPLSNPAVEVCLYAESTTGEFTVGKKTVPLRIVQVRETRCQRLRVGVEPGHEDTSTEFSIRRDTLNARTGLLNPRNSRTPIDSPTA